MMLNISWTASGEISCHFSKHCGLVANLACVEGCAFAELLSSHFLLSCEKPGHWEQTLQNGQKVSSIGVLAIHWCNCVSKVDVSAKYEYRKGFVIALYTTLRCFVHFPRRPWMELTKRKLSFGSNWEYCFGGQLKVWVISIKTFMDPLGLCWFENNNSNVLLVSAGMITTKSIYPSHTGKKFSESPFSYFNYFSIISFVIHILLTCAHQLHMKQIWMMTKTNSTDFLVLIKFACIT